MLEVHRDDQTGEIIVGGMGQLHVEVTVERMKRRFGVEVELQAAARALPRDHQGRPRPRASTRSRPAAAASTATRWIELVPRPRGEGFEFVDKIVGGVIPAQLHPRRGEGRARGRWPRASSPAIPVVDVGSTLYDGKYHPVDSSDMAFKIAGSLGFKKAIEKASPVLLEPIMNVEVTVPEEYVGDIMGDLNSRRGRVLGTDAARPLQRGRGRGAAGRDAAATPPTCTSMTGGRGDYHMEFLRYEEVPAHLAQKVIDQAKAEKEEAAKG